MATRVPLTNRGARWHRSGFTADLQGSGTGWRPWDTESAGDSAVVRTTNTAAGPTNGVDARNNASGSPMEWLTPYIEEPVTISGTITFNIWAAESVAAANTAINVLIETVGPVNQLGTQIIKTARTVELSTTRVAVNFTGTPTSTVINKGDRLRIRIFGDDSTANMGSGNTFNVGFGSPTASVDGDSWVQFTEDFSFHPWGCADLGGLWLSDTPSDVATASTQDRKATIGRAGSGTSSFAPNTPSQAGWHPVGSPITLLYDVGLLLEWFSPPLQGFILSGLCQAELWMHQNAVATQASVACEIARVNQDGSGATVWGRGFKDTLGQGPGALGELAITPTIAVCFVSGPDMTFTDGQRIRIRVQTKDLADAPMAAGGTITINYGNGENVGAQGDSFVLFEVALTELGGAAYPYVGGGYYPVS